MPRTYLSRKAGAKLQHFHELNKSFSNFYLILLNFIHFIPPKTENQFDI